MPDDRQPDGYAIENARFFNAAQQSAARLQYKVGELETLLEAARVLSSSLKPREVLDMLMEVVGRHLVVNSVALWTIADDSVLACGNDRASPGSRESCAHRLGRG